MGVQRMVFVSATFPPFPASVPLKGYIEGKTGKLRFHAGGHMTSLVQNRVHHTSSFFLLSWGRRVLRTFKNLSTWNCLCLRTLRGNL